MNWVVKKLEKLLGQNNSRGEESMVLHKPVLGDIEKWAFIQV